MKALTPQDMGHKPLHIIGTHRDWYWYVFINAYDGVLLYPSEAYRLIMGKWQEGAYPLSPELPTVENTVNK